MLVHLAVLSASFLLGPPPARQLELSLAPSYAQAPTGRSRPALRYQRLRLQLGVAYTADAQHTVYAGLPIAFARQESAQGIEYRNSDLGDAVFGARRWLDRRWHVSLIFAVPLTRGVDQTVYAESGPNLPALDTGRTRTRLDGGWTHRTGGATVDLSVGADVGLDQISVAPVARLSGLLVLLEDALEAGVFMDAKWGLDDVDERWVRVGLVERVGADTGLSGEVVVSTIFAARNTEAATEAGLRLVWRR